MKLSEVILELEKIKKEHGDLPVFHYDDWSEFSVEEISFQSECNEEEEGYFEVAHVLIGEYCHGSGTEISKYSEQIKNENNSNVG